MYLTCSWFHTAFSVSIVMETAILCILHSYIPSNTQWPLCRIIIRRLTACGRLRCKALFHSEVQINNQYIQFCCTNINSYTHILCVTFKVPFLHRMDHTMACCTEYLLATYITLLTDLIFSILLICAFTNIMHIVHIKSHIRQ